MKRREFVKKSMMALGTIPLTAAAARQFEPTITAGDIDGTRGLDDMASGRMTATEANERYDAIVDEMSKSLKTPGVEWFNLDWSE